MLALFAGIPSFMLPALVRPSLGPPASHSPRSQLTTTPAVQTIPQLSRSQSMRSSPVATAPAVQTIPQLPRSQSVRSSPVAIRNLTAHPVQGVQHAAALGSGNSPRPPVISAISPSSLRAAGNICSIAPHLQPCRPTVGAPIMPNTLSTVPQLRPIQMSPQPGQVPSQAPRPPLPNLVTQNSGEVEGGKAAPPNPPRGLAAGYQPYINENRSSPVPDIPSTFRSLEQTDLEMLGNAQHSNRASSAEPDVVCLSDDE